MPLLRFLRRHPLGVLGVIALAFVAWVWRDAIAPRGDPKLADPDSAQHPSLVKRQLQLDVALALDEPPPMEPTKPKPSPQATAQVLTKLKPGMTRAEVEVLVGAPAPHDILPVTVADGRVTYHTAYEADLEPPATVRPIRISRPAPVPPDAKSKERARTLITLEFDATKPGHPLLGIHYPDPLF